MNKNYVIIGGSSGIGKELVKIIAGQGNNVFATYNENIVENSDKVHYQKFDVWYRIIGKIILKWKPNCKIIIPIYMINQNCINN